MELSIQPIGRKFQILLRLFSFKKRDRGQGRAALVRYSSTAFFLASSMIFCATLAGASS